MKTPVVLNGKVIGWAATPLGALRHLAAAGCLMGVSAFTGNQMARWSHANRKSRSVAVFGATQTQGDPVAGHDLYWVPRYGD